MGFADLPGVIKNVATGVTVDVTSSTTSSITALPVNSNGDNPKVVRVVASALVHVKLGGISQTTCARTDPMVTPNTETYFNTMGQHYFTCVLDSSQATSSVLNIIPVEL